MGTHPLRSSLPPSLPFYTFYKIQCPRPLAPAYRVSLHPLPDKLVKTSIPARTPQHLPTSSHIRTHKCQHLGGCLFSHLITQRRSPSTSPENTPLHGCLRPPDVDALPVVSCLSTLFPVVRACFCHCQPCCMEETSPPAEP